MKATHSVFADLVRREFSTRQAVESIDRKLERLRVARAQRAAALKNTRRELAKATPAEPVAVDHNDAVRS